MLPALLAAVPVAGAAEEVVLQSYGVRQGLSHGSAYRVVRDPDGFLWVSTPNGLNRWDGSRFTVFLNEPNVPRSLPDSRVQALVLTGGGDLVVGYPLGVCRFDRKTGECPVLARLPGGVNALLDLPGRGLLVACSRQLVVVGPDGAGRPVALPPNVFPIDLALDPAGTPFVATTAGLFELQGTEAAPVPAASGIALRRLGIDPRGDLLLASEARTYRLRRGSRTIEALPAVPAGAETFLSWNGQLWAGGAFGVVVLDASDQEVRRLRHDPGDAFGLGPGRVNGFGLDGQGGLWMATHQGLFRFDPAAPRFAVTHQSDGLGDEQVWALLRTRDGLLWVGTGDGLVAFDRGGAVVKRLGSAGKAPSLPEGAVRCLAEDGEGRLWIGMARGGLVLLDRPTGRTRLFRRDVANPSGLPGDSLRSLVVTRDGELWVATAGGGLAHLRDASTGRFEVFRHDPKDEASLPDDFLYTLHEDAQGRLWVGTTEGGLAWLDRSTGAFRRFAVAEGTVTSIQDGSAGRIWVTTIRGALLLNPEGSLERRLGPLEGLPSEMTYFALTDRAGSVWIGTNGGLCRLDPGSGHLSVFGTLDGLPSDEFNGGAFLVDGSGAFLAGGPAGFVSFRPETFVPGRVRPRLAVTEVRLPGRRLLGVPATLRLEAHETNVSLAFSLLGFRRPERNRIRYRLDGVDEAFREVAGGAPAWATYTNLPPGRYVFRLQGENGDGVAAAEELEVALVRAPSVLESAWARGLGLASIAGLAVAASVWRVRLLRRRRDELEAEVRERTSELEAERRALEETVAQLERSQREAHQAREASEKAVRAKAEFLANVGHEIRTPLNALVGMSALLLESPLDPEQRELVETVRRSGETLDELLGDILELSRLEGGKLRIEPGPLDVLACVEDAVEMVAAEAAPKGVDLLTDFHPSVPGRVRQDAGRVRQVLLALLANAVKFTAKGEVVVRVTARPAEGRRVELSFAVSDTGIGIAPDDVERIFEPFTQADGSITRSHGGSGAGLAICRHLAQAMGGDVTVASERGRGSTFTLRVLAEPVSGPVQVSGTLRKPARVVVVHRSPAGREVLAAALRQWRLVVETTGELPRTAGAVPPALLVVDEAAVPDSEAWEAVRVPVVLLSYRPRESTAGGPAAIRLRKPCRLRTLQRSIDEALSRGAPVPVPEAPGPGIRKSVLVVEPGAVFRRLAAALLERLGHRATLVRGVEEAEEAVRREEFDAVLLAEEPSWPSDLAGPRRIRQAARGRPALLGMSSAPKDETRRLCLARGLDALLPRPPGLEKLREALGSGREACRLAPVPEAAPPARPQGPALDPTFLLMLAATSGAEAAAEVAAEFAADLPRRGASLAALAVGGDLTALAREAHGLKGTSGTLGAVRLEALAREVERCAKAADLAGASGRIEAIRAETEGVEEALRDLIASGRLREEAPGA